MATEPRQSQGKDDTKDRADWDYDSMDEVTRLGKALAAQDIRRLARS